MTKSSATGVHEAHRVFKTAKAGLRHKMHEKMKTLQAKTALSPWPISGFVRPGTTRTQQRTPQKAHNGLKYGCFKLCFAEDPWRTVSNFSFFLVHSPIIYPCSDDPLECAAITLQNWWRDMLVTKLDWSSSSGSSGSSREGGTAMSTVLGCCCAFDPVLSTRGDWVHM